MRFRLDVNFDDPVTPAPRMIALPSLRPDTAADAGARVSDRDGAGGEAGDGDHAQCGEHPVRDYADVNTLTRTPRPDARRGARCAGRDRPVPRRRGRAAVVCRDDLVELRERTYRAYRVTLGVDGADLPPEFGEVVEAVTTFADPLALTTAELRWRAAGRRWIAST